MEATEGIKINSVMMQNVDLMMSNPTNSRLGCGCHLEEHVGLIGIRNLNECSLFSTFFFFPLVMLPRYYELNKYKLRIMHSCSTGAP